MLRPPRREEAGPVTGLLSAAEARARVLALVTPLPGERISVLSAHGRVLAEDVRAPEAMPPFDNSAMDGFGVQAADVAGATPDSPVKLRVVGNLPAGSPDRILVGPGEAARVMTGAPIPEGVNAIVPLEQTGFWDPAARRARIPSDPDQLRSVSIQAPVAPGAHVRRAGESVARGSRFLEAGTRLLAAEIALLASVGALEVNVHSLPRVGILSTGDELVPPEVRPGPGQIRDSNRLGLLLRLKELGYDGRDLGLVRDDPGELEARIRSALGDLDFLVTSGGVSVGDRDFTRDVLTRIGEVRAYAVAVKPGKPQLCGTVEGVPVFGLPGNPVSSMVVFDQFVLPALRKLAGRRDAHALSFTATLAGPLRRRGGRTEYIRVRLTVEDGKWIANPTGPQGSGILSSMSRADGYAVIPADVESLDPGAPVSCQWIERG